jgi:uncharacterized LabA/DUF88 family protein
MTNHLSRPEVRVAVFIDGLNTMFRLRESNWEESFDVAYLAQRLAKNRILTGTFYFRAVPSMPPLEPSQYWKEVRHLDRVDAQLWELYARKVRLGYMAPRHWGWQEKQTDVWLASEMITQARENTYDIAILVTADTDLVPAVYHVRLLRKGVELAVFPKAHPLVTQLVQAASSTTTVRRSFIRPYR